MKITLGYFNSANGIYLGTSQPADFGNFYLVTGVLRKKICEHPDANPYRRHEIKKHYKSYCDENRIDISIHEYKNYNKHRKIDHHRWYYNDDAERTKVGAENKKLTTIIQFLIANIFPDMFRKYGITSHRYVYLPGYFEINWDGLPE